jgi:hypothetical protein
MKPILLLLKNLSKPTPSKISINYRDPIERA